MDGPVPDDLTHKDTAFLLTTFGDGHRRMRRPYLEVLPGRRRQRNSAREIMRRDEWRSIDECSLKRTKQETKGVPSAKKIGEIENGGLRVFWFSYFQVKEWRQKKTTTTRSPLLTSFALPEDLKCFPFWSVSPPRGSIERTRKKILSFVGENLIE